MSKRIFLLLIIFATLIIGFPSYNFQDLLSQGDHGRDLYASEAVYRGELPFKDFWWVYGPLMPYYYGLFFLSLGTKISSILVGKLILEAVCGVLFFLAGSVIMPAWLSFIAALFFIAVQSDFFFTYNHIGGIVTIIGFLWMALEYLKKRQLSYAWKALGFIFVLGLIKINFACAALAALGFATLLNAFTDQQSRQTFWQSKQRYFYITAAIGLPLCWLGIYLFFLRGLSIAEIRQCLPYLGGDQPYNYPPSVTIPYYFNQHWLTITHQWQQTQQLLLTLKQQPSLIGNPNFLVIFAASFLTISLHPIWHLSTITAFIKNALPKVNSEERQMFWVTVLFLLVFFLLNFHEFIVSGVWYRSFWTQPILILFQFFTLSVALTLLPKFIRIIIAIIFGTLLILSTFAQYQTKPQSKKESQFLNVERGNIYVGNQAAWVDTVRVTTTFLNQTLKKDEQFFALPYDDIYYYLTGKKTPTRQLIFFDHIKIQPDQEASIIQELEKNKIAYVLMSNRVAANETGLGIWGKTYCPLIYKYVTENFVPVYKYGGNWQAEPGWADNHGVIIFKRK